MTAPTNLVPQFAAFGASGQAGGANGAAAAGPLAGFEALLAALFPQPGAAPGPASTIASADTITLEDAQDPDAAAQDPGQAAADAAAVAAALLVPAAVTGETAQTTAPATAPDATPDTAAGAKRAAFTVPAQATPPGLAAKAELAPEAADTAEEAPALPPGQVAKTERQPGKADAAPAFGRDKAPGAPAQPALDNANPKADLAAKAAATPADPAEAAETPQPAAPTAPAQTAEAAKAAPAPVASPRAEPPAKPARTERKPATESLAADALKPREAVDRPVHARAAETAARTAAAAVEALEPKARDEKAVADQPDSAAPGDTRATTASSAPAAPAAHAVRGSPETVATLAAQIVKKLEERSTRFDLELDPAGLGRVDVRIEIGAHGKLTASMLFDNPQAANDLKARAAELQRALEQAGFDLSGGLSFDVADQGRHQGRAWQDQDDTSRSSRGQAFRAALETAGEADAPNTGALRLRRGVTAGVDVRI